MTTRYTAPEVQDEDVTVDFVRDELLKCFESANGEFYELQGKQVPEDELKRQVQDFVQGAFLSCGASFEQPTEEGIKEAIEECKKNAQQSFGESGSEIIDHHYAEMMKLVSKLS